MIITGLGMSGEHTSVPRADCMVLLVYGLPVQSLSHDFMVLMRDHAESEP